MSDPWNRCDVCGRFISYAALDDGSATRHQLTPDSHLTREEYETLCGDHSVLQEMMND